MVILCLLVCRDRDEIATAIVSRILWLPETAAAISLCVRDPTIPTDFTLNTGCSISIMPKHHPVSNHSAADRSERITVIRVAYFCTNMQSVRDLLCSGNGSRFHAYPARPEGDIPYPRQVSLGTRSYPCVLKNQHVVVPLHLRS